MDRASAICADFVAQYRLANCCAAKAPTERDVNNVAAATVEDHLPGRRLRAVECAFKIHIDYLIHVIKIAVEY